MPEEKKVVQAGSDRPAAREWDRSTAGDLLRTPTTPAPLVSPVEGGPQLLMFGALHRRAQQSLLENLLPGEEPRVVVPGAAGCGIIGTDTRALVIKAGTRFGTPFRGRCKAFEYESVIGVRLDTESLPAVVAIDAPHKIVSCRVYWADPRDDPWKARNAIPVDPAGFGIVLEHVVALRALIEAFRKGHPAIAPHPAPTERRAVVAPLPVLTERCPRCRTELRPGWHFCPECGAPSETPQAGAS
jgi:zinc-ribbon domain